MNRSPSLPTSSLLDCLMACLRSAPDQAVAMLEGCSEVDLRQFATFALNHGVAPLLYSRLQAGGFSQDNQFLATLRQTYLHTTASNMRLLHDLVILLRALRQARVPVIVLKGLPLALSAYGQIGLRPMGDLDLLVPHDQLRQAVQALIASGCADLNVRIEVWDHNHHFRFQTPVSASTVELHWTIINPSVASRIDLPGIWARADAFTFHEGKDKETCLVLDAEDQLVHLCVHHCQHIQNASLKLLVDIREWIRCRPDLDWEQVCRHAIQSGVAAPVYITLRLAANLLEADVPREVFEALRPDDFQEEFLDVFCRQYAFTGQTGGNTATTYLASLSIEKSLKTKLVILAQRLFPSRKSMSYLYPARANSWRILLYYPVRWVKLVERHTPFLWRMARADALTRAEAQGVDQNARLHAWLFPDSVINDRDI